MLKIQVLGKGLIPRGLGLAPRKEPFFADYRTIADIVMNYQNFTVNLVEGESNDQLTEITRSNIKKIWDKKVNNYEDTTSTPVQPPVAEGRGGKGPEEVSGSPRRD